MSRAATTKEEALLVSLLKSLQAAGLGAGARLPVERDQMREFGISRTTVRRALARLERADLIERRHGSGTYLKRAVTDSVIRQVTERHDRLDRLGQRVLTQPSYRLAVLHDHESLTPVFKRVLRGIQDYAAARGHTVELGPSRPPYRGEAPRAFAREVYTSNADGLIIAATIRPGDYQQLDRVGRPYVLLTDQPTGNAISLDMQGSCRRGVEELVSLGHRRIAVLEKDYENKRPVLRHVCAFLREDWDLSELSYHFGPDPLRELPRNGAFPTALLIKDDVYCRQTCEAMISRGVVIGRDVEVISFANRGVPAGLPKTVGRVEFDLEEFGRLAAQAIEMSLGDGKPAPPLRVGGRYVPASRTTVSVN
jgi:DNA-binding LacI/PurR family transcriptional regulator